METISCSLCDKSYLNCLPLISSATDILYIGLSPTLSCIKTFSDPIFSFLGLPCCLLRWKSLFLTLYIEVKKKTSKLNNVCYKKCKENFHFSNLQDLVTQWYYLIGIRKCCKTISKQFLVNVDKISFQWLSLGNLKIPVKVDSPLWIQMGKSNLWIPWGKYKAKSFLPLFPFQSQMKWFEERFPKSFSSFRR